MNTVAVIVAIALLGCFPTPTTHRPWDAPLEPEKHACALLADGFPACSCVRTGPDTAVTAAHCVGVDDSYSVQGRSVISIARMVGNDVAYLRLGGTPDRTTKPRAGKLGTGRWVLGFGCAWQQATWEAEMRPLRSLGYSRLWDRWSYRGVVCGGDSGAGVWTDQGALVGIVTAKGADGVVFVDEVRL